MLEDLGIFLFELLALGKDTTKAEEVAIKKVLRYYYQNGTDGSHSLASLYAFVDDKKDTLIEDLKIQEKHFNLYDWRQLQRWGIAEKDLPPGSIVRYRNLTFYETYKWYIRGGILLILFEALMIFHLLFNRSRRLRAERKVQRAHNELGRWLQN